MSKDPHVSRRLWERLESHIHALMAAGMDKEAAHREAVAEMEAQRIPKPREAIKPYELKRRK